MKRSPKQRGTEAAARVAGRLEPDGAGMGGGAMTCAAPDCTRAPRARGYCDTHYRRVRKWGDPTIVLKPWGTDHLQGSS